MGAVLAAGVAPAAAQAAQAQADDAPDQLIFKDGRIIQGKVIEETETHVKFLVVVAGISGEQTYSKTDILAIERGERAEGEGGEEAPPATTTPRSGEGPDKPAAPEGDEADDGAPSVYVIELKGKFGRDITMTPIRNIIKDAAKHKPDYVIVVADNAWTFQDGSEAPNDAALFGQIFLAEDIEPIFTAEMPQIFGYEPEVIFWVKSAMGGMAFLPFNFDTMYFSSGARMGGIGNLIYQYGNTGDEMVREKLFSAGMGHAEGMAIHGGYDPRIIRAMARTDYVLSYRIENGQVVLVENEPRPEFNEYLLTDDGTISEQQDTDRELARGEGNDTLTLTAKVAHDLGVSKGTADTLDALLYELQIERRHRLIEGRSERIMEEWSDSVRNAERSLKRLWKEFAEIQVQGERRERTMARARQMRTLDQIIQLLEKYAEVDKLGLFEHPEGLPDVPSLRVLREQIRQEQMKDR
ncbi:MAG TPA: hypothetical protein VFF69_11935 [Phycisphaerales bacterium]|nr:hypothetical protein [Phycisphaerales bacterium]